MTISGMAPFGMIKMTPCLLRYGTGFATENCVIFWGLDEVSLFLVGYELASVLKCLNEMHLNAAIIL